jgi:MoCo/4Fe-4S cofactor protein with predicted Tat translocation signal
MPNVFHPVMNTLSRVSIYGAVFMVAGVLALLWFLVRTPYMTEAGVIREQPIPFSHQHHVGDVGLDCRYCHTTVETSAFAGLPATSVCLNCHSHLFADQPILQPVRDSYANDQPIEWTRVHDLPDHAHFNHQIHIHKGVACVTCHGRVDEMPLMYRENSLLMEWCLQCHREPEQHIRPREFVFRLESLEELSETSEFRDYVSREFPSLAGTSVELPALRRALAERYDVESQMNCSNCHY